MSLWAHVEVAMELGLAGCWGLGGRRGGYGGAIVWEFSADRDEVLIQILDFGLR